MEVGYDHSIEIVEELCIWEVDEESVEKSNGVGPPRDVPVDY